MAEQLEPTCDDCFFRQAELCAIPGNVPCPTFRSCTGETLDPVCEKLTAGAEPGGVLRLEPVASAKAAA